MTTHFRVGGAWKDLDQPSVKVGGVWKDCDSIHIRVGGVWKEVWAGVSITVTLNTADVTHSTTIGICYANLQYNTSGEEFRNSSGFANNFTTSRGDWLDVGSSSDVWLERTINSGTLFTDPGSGRLNMGTTRSFRVRDTNSGAGGVSCDMDIEMWDAASGGSSLDSVAGLTLTATYYDPCPGCCFTPDTLITMADGSTKAIGDIVPGDIIRGHDGEEIVEEVQIREDRPMWEMMVSDGRKLILSEDHPVYVEGKGYSSISPEGQPYKDMVTTNKIELGDMLMLEGGILLSVERLIRYEYPLKVYGLLNNRYYANGILVY